MRLLLAVACFLFSTCAFGQIFNQGSIGNQQVLNFAGGIMIPGGQDNSPFLSQLLLSLGPPGFGYGEPGSRVTFSPIANQFSTEYYFSQALDWTRGGIVTCAAEGAFQPVGLIFAPGVDGFIFDTNTTSPDGGFAGGTLDGCQILSLSYGTGSVVNGNTNVTSVSMSSYGAIPATTWAIGDGAIIIPKFNDFAIGLLTPTGTNVTGVSGSTITLSSAPTWNAATQQVPTGKAVLYRLPTTLAYSATTSTSNNTVTLTGGPSIPFEPGDLIWSDAFPFGSTVWTVSGTAPTQTLTIVTVFNSGVAVNASVNHAAGSGKIWKIPAGVRRRTGSITRANAIDGWPIGLSMACASGATPGLGCTGSYDEGNFFGNNLIGRFVSGNNTGASTSHANKYGKNYFADIVEGGSISTYYSGDNSNSAENSSSSWGIEGNCGFQTPVFIGVYDGGAGLQPYCMPPWSSAGLNTPPVAAPPGALFIGDEAGAPSDSNHIESGFMSGEWKFTGAASPGPLTTNASTANGNATLHFASVPAWIYPTLSIIDQTTSGVIPANTTVLSTTATTVVMSANATGAGVGSGDSILISSPGSPPCVDLNGGLQANFNLKLSKDCGTFSGIILNWTGNLNSWDLYTNGNSYPGGAPLIRLTSSDGTYVGDNGDGLGYPYFMRGLFIGNSSIANGAERILDTGAAAQANTWNLQGDRRFSTVPTAGGFAEWVSVGAGSSNVRPAAPVANDSAGNQWTLPITINTSTTFSGLPTCNAGLKGGHQFITDGAAAPVFSAAAAGSGSLFTPVYCDGTTWRNG